jgi:undecaprenyl diphosphate synthase
MKILESETQSQLPKTIGIIMDGNRRYATERGLAKIKGHTAGYKKLLEVCDWSRKAGVETLVVYAFSTENWNRSHEEVTALTGLLAKALTTKSLRKKHTRVRIIGQKDRFGKDMQRAIRDIEQDTKSNGPFTLVIALSYGGHAEITSAVNSLLKKGKTSVTEKDIEKELWAGEYMPDMIVRTGGEKRLSNFLPWQSVYSELFFIDTYWPALTQDNFIDLVTEYVHRKRNFGV